MGQDTSGSAMLLVVLYHVSQQHDITRFEPRPSEFTSEPVVWAVDEERLRNYLLPRDCPRVTFYAGPRTSDIDVERFGVRHRAVVAIERGWLERVRSTRLFVYRMPPENFSCIDECAGHFVSLQGVSPERMEIVDNLLDALNARGVEVRILPSLWSLHDAVARSTLQFSMIRMRNAKPPE
jgi:hypothetical protein